MHDCACFHKLGLCFFFFFPPFFDVYACLYCILVEAFIIISSGRVCQVSSLDVSQMNLIWRLRSSLQCESKPVHMKGLMCNRPKQVLLSWTSVIADEGESLPVWDWVSGLLVSFKRWGFDRYLGDDSVVRSSCCVCSKTFYCEKVSVCAILAQRQSQGRSVM